MKGMNETLDRDVLKAPVVTDSPEDTDLYLWLVIGCSLGGALLFTLAITALLYARRRSRKKVDQHHPGYIPGSEFCPQDMISSFSSSPSEDTPELVGSRFFHRPLGPSASLDPSSLGRLTKEYVQPRPSLPRWHTFSTSRTTPILMDERDSDEELPSCQHGRLWFSLSYKEGKLHATLHRAKYLPGRGILNAPRDPFVKVYLLPDEENFQQSKVQKRTLEPKFNETFTFDVNPDDLRKRTLKFSVYDVDKRKIRHCLGHALQPLDLLESMGSGQFYKDLEIAPQATAPPGDVQLSLSCNPFSNRIKVTVWRIRLPDHHSAVFVRVELYHGRRMVKSKRTRTVKCSGCEEQIVDESFGFAVSGRFFDSCSLEFVVVVEGGTPLGKVVVGPFMYARGEPLQHWQEMLSNSRNPVTRWHPLSDCSGIDKR